MGPCVQPLSVQRWRKTQSKGQTIGVGMMKILIVDDNKSIIRLIKEILETEGNYNVKTAENGEEGFVVFLSFKPDIVLTDIEMPVKNGFEMIRNIRALHPGVKTVYMSADLNRYRSLLEEEKIKYKASFLNKPFTCSNIVDLFHEKQKLARS